MHTSLPQKVFYDTVLKLGAVVREEDFWTAESEKYLPIKLLAPPWR